MNPTLYPTPANRIRTRHVVLTAVAVMISAWNWHARAEEPAALILELNAGNCDRELMPVEAALPDNAPAAETLWLKRIDNGRVVPVQEISSKPRRISWQLEETLRAGTIRKYQLIAGGQQSHEPAVRVKDDGKRILVNIGERLVLAYNHATVASPDPGQPYYARSGYLHPVNAPNGQTLTDDFNPDHPHQHGIMFAWRKGVFEGRSTNPWHQAEQSGRTEHVEMQHLSSGAVFGQFTASLRQLDLTAPDRPRTIFNEFWTVRVSGRSDVHILDIEIRQVCAGSSPYEVQRIHYGGFAIRGSRSWGDHKTPEYDVLTDKGLNRIDGNQSRARWVNFFGTSDDAAAGMVVFCHPDNYQFPQPVRLHPRMPYFCFSPASAGTFQITPDAPYVSRYRVFCHNGNLTADRIHQLWESYVNPPIVRVSATSAP